MTYIKTILIISLALLWIPQGMSQTKNVVIEGVVSYITGESIYVKFKNTTGIENGDTLYLKKNEILIPALIVMHHSSISCLTNLIDEHQLKISDVIFAKIKVKTEVEEKREDELLEGKTDISEHVLKTEIKEAASKTSKENIKGRISVSSYSNFAQDGGNNSQRLRYTFSLDAKNISNSKVSVQSYISFVHKINEWDVVKDNIFNALKIYSLAVKYSFNENTNLWIGRKINPKIANVGVVDGLQFQTNFNAFSAGVVIGTRPDFKDYSFNADLFEFGGYLSHSKKFENGFVQSSIAFFEQRNKSNIDRRFMYFQHSNMLAKNLNFFSSSEVELYKVEDGAPVNSISLTSLYLSLRYRFSKAISILGSYDTRKNVIYYETFKNYADQILQQATRQGMRLRINLRPIKYLNVSVNAGTRFSDADARKTKTLNFTSTYTQVPYLKASVTLTANLMQTSYLDGAIYGIRISKDIIKGKLFTVLQYRYVNFDYINSLTKLNEHISEIDLSYQFNKKVFFSFNFENAFQRSNNSSRIYLNIRKKF